MAKLLKLFFDGGILSHKSRNYLLRLMASNALTPKRIKGLLPAEATVPHRSGSSGTDEKGVAAATNDVGIIALPDGRKVALVVFVSDSGASSDQSVMVIASIARAVWDDCSTR